MPDFDSLLSTFGTGEWNWFLRGFVLGVCWGGVAWTFRIVRQAGRQNPEI